MFKESHTFEERVKESERVRAKYPDRIPVICEKVETSSMEDLDKKKYLVPFDLICGHFNYMIHRRLKLPSEKALILFVNGSIPPISATMSELYDQLKDKDGFLYEARDQLPILQTVFINENVETGEDNVVLSLIAIFFFIICAIFSIPIKSESPDARVSTQKKTRLNFRDQLEFEERKLEADNNRAKYPDRLSVICEKVETSSMEVEPSTSLNLVRYCINPRMGYKKQMLS
eukprot:gene6610-7303_t